MAAAALSFHCTELPWHVIMIGHHVSLHGTVMLSCRAPCEWDGVPAAFHGQLLVYQPAWLYVH
jgi:hypothetical protein